MKKVFMFSYLLILLVGVVHALEIDEKLTVRILKVSSSKKTVLTNRGLEDGLVVDDHAKFFLTTGVIARGVVVKASPSRSIWSIYRLVDSDAIEKDKVVKLKISSPVKLTEDPSKMLIEEDKVDEVAVRPAEPVEEMEKEDKEELAELKRLSPKRRTRTPGILAKKSWEFWGGVSGSMLSGTLVRSDNYDDIELSGTFINGTVGIEKYMGADNVSGFLSHVSAQAFATMLNVMSSGAEGESTGFEVGLGLNYHFGNSVHRPGKMIWYAHLEASLAMPMSLTATDVSESAIGGSGYSYAFGGGIKYYMKSGLGIRAQAAYYARSESYKIEGSDSWSNALVGVRGGAYLSYRF